jgi:hypothetical protein
MLTLLISATAAFLILMLFAKEAREAVTSIADAISKLIAAGDGLLTAAIRGIWNCVKPTEPVKPVGTTIGLLLLVTAGAIVVANYAVLHPTLEILLPVGDASAYLAAAIVALGGTIGVLWHMAKSGRPLYFVAVLTLIVGLGYLTFVRTMVVTDEDLKLAAMATAITVMLQVFEIITIAGGLHLCAEVLPVVVASPVVLPFGAVWTIVRMLKMSGLDAGAILAVIDAAERAFAYLHGLAKRFTKEARMEARFARQKLEFDRAADFSHRAAEIDKHRQQQAVLVEEAEAIRRVQAAHQPKIDELNREAELEHLPAIRRHVFAAGEGNIVAVIDELAQELRQQVKAQVRLEMETAARNAAKATLAVYQHAGLYRDNGGSKNGDAKKTPFVN